MDNIIIGHQVNRTGDKMKRANYKSLPEKIADVISDMIYRNNYSVGAKLPNEIVLAAELEVSRNTVREAVRMLSEKHVLEVKRGAGTFVSAKLGLTEDPLGLGLVSDKNKLVRDLIEIRILIEPRIASLAAEYASLAEVEHLGDILRAGEEAFAAGKNYYDQDMEFHTWIANCSRNLVVHNLLPPIHQAFLLQEKVMDNWMGEKTMAAHKRIFKAIEDRRCNEAFDAMAAHLMQNQERVLIG